MSNLNAIFRTLAAAELPLKDLIETANRLFCNSTLPAHFATVVCAGLSGQVQLSSAMPDTAVRCSSAGQR